MCAFSTKLNNFVDLLNLQRHASDLTILCNDVKEICESTKCFKPVVTLTMLPKFINKSYKYSTTLSFNHGFRSRPHFPGRFVNGAWAVLRLGAGHKKI